MRLMTTCAALMACFFFSCSTKTVVQEIRHPLIQFSYNALTWSDNIYGFLQPIQIVSYPTDPTQPGKIYNRFTLQATGNDSKGNTLQFNLVFDVADSTQMVGLYHLTYSPQRGLAQVQLYNFDPGNPSYFQLCADDSSSVLQIEKQSLTENLVTGSFQFTLCNARDTTQKISVSNGVLTDIHY